MKINMQAKPKLAIGQVWKNRRGYFVEIVGYDAGSTCPWEDSDGCTYHDDGRYQVDGTYSTLDLVELVYDTPTECSQVDTKPSLPRPLTQVPLAGRTYYTPSVTSEVAEFVWANDEIDKSLFSKGLVFETQEEASEAAKFMLQAWKQALKASEN